MSKEEHLRRLDYVLHTIPQSIWPSTGIFKDKFAGQTAIIVGGGSSLKDTFPRLRASAMDRTKFKVFAPNKSHDWLIKGERIDRKKWARLPLVPDFGVMIDPAEWVITYQTPHPRVRYLFGHTLDPRVFAKFLNAQAQAFIWIPVHSDEVDAQIKAFETDGFDRHFVAGGSTVGLRTINLAMSMGFDAVELHGFDSCFAPNTKTLYAYDKPVINMDLADYPVKAFDDSVMRVRSNAMMAKQAIEFADFITRIPDLIQERGRFVKVVVHGDGVIPWMSWKASQIHTYIEHADPEAMQAKYGAHKFWDYAGDCARAA